MKPIFTTLQADLAIEHYAAYYESQRPGYGFVFEQYLERVWETLRRQPRSGLQWRRGTRLTKTDKFPIYIIYRVRRNDILIHKVVYCGRHPRNF